MIPIFSKEPNNWRELQDMVATIFLDMGYETTVEKDIKTVRGKVNVDVFAHKKVQRLSETVIVECKNWARAVTKSTIHSFRTIVSDSGANLGLIVSKKGFQKGAYEAAENSNILLLTFEEFQIEFRDQWLDDVIERNATAVYPLRRYCDVMDSFIDKHIEQLTEEKQQIYRKLINQYDSLSGLASRMFYKSIGSNKLHNYLEEVILENYKRLPLNNPASLHSYFDFLHRFSLEGLKAFDNLFEKKIRKWDR